jgi:RNA polymerase sigma-70 factor (ECF subfamily)
LATTAEVLRLERRELPVWEDLVRAQYQRIYNLHLRLSPHAEVAADLTQDTFEQAWKSAAAYQGRSRPEVWLYGVALNVNRNWWSRQHQPQELGDDPSCAPTRLEDLPDPEPTAEELAILHGRSDLICAAVRRLPETYRRTVALRYFLGVSAVEIAASEGVEAGTVRWRLHEALRRLWIMLQPTLGKESEEDAPGNHRTIRFAS